MKKMALMMMTLCLAACATAPTPTLTACNDNRPQVCAKDYRPVCAFNEKGKKIGTYGNTCSACGNSKVLGYTAGACK